MSQSKSLTKPKYCDKSLLDKLVTEKLTNPNFNITKLIEKTHLELVSSFIDSDTLPYDILYNQKELLKEIGFSFFERVPNNEVLQFVTMPNGWKKLMPEDVFKDEIKLVDEKSRVRGYIVYEPIYYKKSATMVLVNRIFPLIFLDNINNINTVHCLVQDFDESIIIDFGTKQLEGESDVMNQQINAVTNKLGEWLIENFPDFNSPIAYWDLDKIIPKNCNNSL